MITLDPRTPNERRDDPHPEYTDLQRHLTAIGVPSVFSRLEFGDASLLGYGPAEIPVLVGVEIKKIGEILARIQDGHFSAHQLPGMLRSYSYRYLVIEGEWKPDPQGHVVVRRGGDWARPGTQMLASGVSRWLLTMDTLAGIRVMMTKDRHHTARYLSDLWHWWSQPWGSHSSHLALEEFDAAGAGQQHIELTRRSPEWTLCHRWAQAIPGVGRVKAEAVADYFETGHRLATAGIKQWGEIKGIGKGIASDAVRFIMGGDHE